MRLCDLCARLETRVHRKHRQRGSCWCTVYTHQPRRENGESSIRASAEAGCYFCSKFRSSLSSQHREIVLGPDFKGLLVSLYWNEKEGRFTQLHFIIGIEFDGCDQDVTDTFDLFPTTSRKYLHSSLRIKQLKQTGTQPSMSLHTLNVVPYWLRTCLTKHKGCCSEPPEWLPTRLIDVGNALQDAPARLVFTESLQPCSCLYLALSHGGFSDKSASLTTANIQDYENQIVLGELPTLFQLAIRAAKTLKLRYLWIEDLCVLQDSKEDVATERLDKGRICGNSRITVTATSLRYMYEVLTGSSRQSLHSTATLALLHDQGLGCSSKAYTAVPADVWTKELFESIVASNSSNFVEDLALQRRLHFGAMQLYWKCRGLTACEILLDGDPRKVPQLLIDEANDTIARHRNKDVGLESELWGQPIERYTRKVSKVPQARLALMSSYSEELADRYALSYAAGLWRESLIADLLW